MGKGTIYFFVALLLLSLGLTLVPKAFSQTQNIKIVSYSYYVDSAGYLDVVGEIQNVGSNTIAQVDMTGSVYSPGGTDQSDSQIQAYVAYLLPQQKAPFDMVFYSPNDSPDGTWSTLIKSGDISNIVLAVAQGSATTSYQYPDLKVASSSATIGNSGNFSGVYLVSGVVENTGSQTAQNIWLVGTFYNSSGTVVAVGYSNYLTPSALAPSGTASFQVPAFDVNQTGVPSNEKISSYSLLVQAQGPILQGSPPTVTPYQAGASASSTSPTSSSASTSSTSSSASSSSTGATSALGGANSNNSLNWAIVYAVVVVVLVLAVVGTVIALRKRKPQETTKRARGRAEQLVKNRQV